MAFCQARELSWATISTLFYCYVFLPGQRTLLGNHFYPVLLSCLFARPENFPGQPFLPCSIVMSFSQPRELSWATISTLFYCYVFLPGQRTFLGNHFYPVLLLCLFARPENSPGQPFLPCSIVMSFCQARELSWATISTLFYCYVFLPGQRTFLGNHFYPVLLSCLFARPENFPGQPFLPCSIVMSFSQPRELSWATISTLFYCYVFLPGQRTFLGNHFYPVLLLCLFARPENFPGQPFLPCSIVMSFSQPRELSWATISTLFYCYVFLPGQRTFLGNHFYPVLLLCLFARPENFPGQPFLPCSIVMSFSQPRELSWATISTLFYCYVFLPGQRTFLGNHFYPVLLLCLFARPENSPGQPFLPCSIVMSFCQARELSWATISTLFYCYVFLPGQRTLLGNHFYPVLLSCLFARPENFPGQPFLPCSIVMSFCQARELSWATISTLFYCHVFLPGQRTFLGNHFYPVLLLCLFARPENFPGQPFLPCSIVMSFCQARELSWATISTLFY